MGHPFQGGGGGGPPPSSPHGPVLWIGRLFPHPHAFQEPSPRGWDSREAPVHAPGVGGHYADDEREGTWAEARAPKRPNLPLMILQKMHEASLWVAIFLAAAADQGFGIDGVKREALVGRRMGVLSSRLRVVVVVVRKGRSRCM